MTVEKRRRLGRREPREAGVAGIEGRRGVGRRKQVLEALDRIGAVDHVLDARFDPPLASPSRDLPHRIEDQWL